MASILTGTEKRRRGRACASPARCVDRRRARSRADVLRQVARQHRPAGQAQNTRSSRLVKCSRSASRARAAAGWSASGTARHLRDFGDVSRPADQLASTTSFASGKWTWRQRSARSSPRRKPVKAATRKSVAYADPHQIGRATGPKSPAELSHVTRGDEAAESPDGRGFRACDLTRVERVSLFAEPTGTLELPTPSLRVRAPRPDAGALAQTRWAEYGWVGRELLSRGRGSGHDYHAD